MRAQNVRMMWVVLAAALVGAGLVGCGDDDRPVVPDGGRDAAVPDGGGPVGPTITICPGDALPPAPDGRCSVTAGSGAMLITADVLTPGEVFRGGQVAVSAGGTIECVGCNCATAPSATGATAIVCPDGAISPGLVNTHDHLTFTQNHPYTATDERYEQRHDWRKHLRGHTAIPAAGGASTTQMAWGELRFVLGGGTSINGSGGAGGMLRNLDSSLVEGLGQPAAKYDTFPLGDDVGVGQQFTPEQGCAGYGGISTAASIAGFAAYTPHVAEGIDSVARNEFLCMRAGATDLVQPQSAFIHGVALLPQDIAEMATDGTSLIWSPRSNITLYGDTARVTEYARLGVPIALGTDWTPTGSMNLLRELQCADELNSNYYDNFFTNEQLWLMVTRNAAAALAVDDVIGTIAVGKVADLAIYDARIHTDYRAVIDAAPADVMLVVRGGVPLYGDAALIEALPTGGTTCDTLDVCATPKRVCVMREDGQTLAALTAANTASYGLFFCGIPDNEPSCIPERNGTTPSPVVNGSTRYTGVTGGADTDGDGIPDTADNCPRVFNPVRPVDNGVQADFDVDGVGDSCDVCPLDANTTVCSGVDPNDTDRDGEPNATDNCPNTPNADQLDTDTDGLGDVCDACPTVPNPGGSACPGTIYDVNTGAAAVGAMLSIAGSIVTAVGTDGFFMQVVPGSAGDLGFDNSGIFVYTGAAPTVARGDLVDLTTTTVGTHGGFIELTTSTIVVVSSGNAMPEPVVATPAELTTGGARAGALQGVLVQVATVAVTDVAPALSVGDFAPSNEYLVGTLRVDDLLYLTTPFPVVGEGYTSITGVLVLRNGDSKLLPRDAADVVSNGIPVIVGLEPALSYARVGAAAPTFPSPLTVRLSRAAVSATTVTLGSSGAGLTVANVVVPIGATSAVVPVTGVTFSLTPYTVTATLDGLVRTADVRVIGATEVPVLTSLTPLAPTVLIGATQTFTVTLSIPAPAGGTTVTLASTAGGTLPASVLVPADATSATFTFTAGAAPASVTVTATLGADVITTVVTVNDAPPPDLVINEVDYDQVGTDSAEFIEIYNPSATARTLDGLSVILINGSGATSIYGTYPLTGSLAGHAYLLLAQPVVTGPAGTRVIPLTGALQNGGTAAADPGDAIALIETATGTVIDALSYESAITTAVVAGGTPVSLVAGSRTLAADSNTLPGSLCRAPNGSDTGNDLTDWAFVATPTPGAANP
jgi:imidazolonepropionase-like amidohydrolase